MDDLEQSLYDKFTEGGRSLENAIFSYITADTSVFLEGANKRFYSEHGYTDGVQLLYNIPYHPLVSGSFLKLTQEVTSLSYQVLPSENIARTKALTHAQYIKEVFNTVGISSFYEDLLLAYITGVIAHELVWTRKGKTPTLEKIIAIPPEYFWPDERGLNLRKSVNSHEVVPNTPNKYSKFAYSQFLHLSPLGDGVGKVLYYLLKQREKIECLANIFALRGSTPTVVLSVTGEVKTATVKSIIADLNKTESWKNIALPPNMKLESLNNSGARYEIYELLLSENKQLITDLLAGESIVGGSSTTGQRGAEEATNLRKTRAIKIGLKAVEHINKVLVRPLITYKYGPQEFYPTFLYNMPVLSKLGLASIDEAIAVQATLGYEVSPSWYEKNYQLDIINVGADS